MRYRIFVCLILANCASSSKLTLPTQNRFGLSEPHVLPSRTVEVDLNTPTVSLDTLIIFAMRHAPSIKKARTIASLSESARIDAELYFRENPEVSFSLGARFENTEVGVDLGIGVEQTFEIGGQRGLRIDVAEEKNKVASSKLNEAKWMLASNIRSVFYDLLLIEERKIQAEKFVEFSKSLREVTAKKVRSGESSPLDLLVADADLAQSQEALIEAKRFEKQKKLYLGSLIGWDKEIKLSGKLPEAQSPRSAKNLILDMKKNHPSIRTKEIEIWWKVKAAKLQERKAWISPRVGLNYTRESSPQGGAIPQILGVSLAFPLNMWNQNQAAIQFARTEIVIASQERELNYHLLLTDLNATRSQVESALEIVKLYQHKIIPKLEESFRSIRRSYALGEVDITQISLTRQKLFEVSTRYSNARLHYYKSMVSLSNLVGDDLFRSKK